MPSRTLPTHPAEAYRGDLQQAVDDIRGWITEGRDVVVVHAGHGPAERFVELLGENDIAARLVEEGDTAGPNVVTVTCGHLVHGIVDDEAQVAVVTGDDLSGQKTSTRDMRKMPARRKKQIDPLELKAGDYVVHEQHGVGRFVEMKQREIGGAVREYLVLEYGPSKRGGPNDMLYVPADTLDQVTRYVGGENPSLDRLGGGDWTKRKNKARRAVREIAAELIKLYAARQATKGYAYGPDTPWQRELEDAFPFTETVDQLTTVDEVKADMRQVVPMDRLVCGDVGYGKTEIAVRAAFKAVQDGKQVAVLVPTTLLVTQHLSTFSERMSRLPGRHQGPLALPDRQGGQGGHRRARRRVGRHRRRHPPPAQPRHQGQGPRPDHRRRGAALRCRAQGADEADAHVGRRAVDERDADPAHPRDGGDRHPRDVDDHHPARGAAPGPHLRRRLRGPPGRRGRTP